MISKYRFLKLNVPIVGDKLSLTNAIELLAIYNEDSYRLHMKVKCSNTSAHLEIHKRRLNIIVGTALALSTIHSFIFGLVVGSDGGFRPCELLSFFNIDNNSLTRVFRELHEIGIITKNIVGGNRKAIIYTYTEENQKAYSKLSSMDAPRTSKERSDNSNNRRRSTNTAAIKPKIQAV